MNNYIGYFATSLAGHDKGLTYVITGVDNEYVYVADGVSKTLEKPKKKNKKHIQIIKKKAIEIIADEQHVKAQKLADNEQVKRAIKLYR